MAATKGWPTVDLSNRHFYPSQGYKNNSLEAYGDYYPTYQKWALCLLPHSLLPSAAAECRCLCALGGSQRRRSSCDTSLYLSFSIKTSHRLFNCWSSASILALGPHSLHQYFLVRSKLPVRPIMSKLPRSQTSHRRHQDKTAENLSPSLPRKK